MLPLARRLPHAIRTVVNPIGLARKTIASSCCPTVFTSFRKSAPWLEVRACTLHGYPIRRSRRRSKRPWPNIWLRKNNNNSATAQQRMKNLSFGIVFEVPRMTIDKLSNEPSICCGAALCCSSNRNRVRINTLPYQQQQPHHQRCDLHPCSLYPTERHSRTGNTGLGSIPSPHYLCHPATMPRLLVSKMATVLVVTRTVNG